jgi:dipeptidase D
LYHLRQQHLALYGKDLAVQAIHAGLECGCFKGIAPQLDMVSFGPEIQSPHSPGERVNIPSVARFHKLLRAVLENLSPSAD